MKMHKHIIELCPEHSQVEYDEKHDAYYCPSCLKWLEDKCGNPKCGFCKGRPKHHQKS